MLTRLLRNQPDWQGKYTSKYAEIRTADRGRISLSTRRESRPLRRVPEGPAEVNRSTSRLFIVTYLNYISSRSLVKTGRLFISIILYSGISVRRSIMW